MNVIHLVDDVSPLSYGLGEVCKALAIEQNGLGYNAHIWSNTRREDSSRIDAETRLITSLYPPDIVPIRLSFREAADVRRQPRSTVVHQHGIWTGKSVVAAAARRKGMTTIIAPHGYLRPRALKKSRLKKAIVNLGYEDRNFRMASGFHALSEVEIDDIRNRGLQSPAALITNGISSNWLESVADGSTFRSTYNIPEDSQVMLYLSRITPIKGLDMLFNSLANINYNNWTIVMAGSDEFGHLAEIQQLIKEKDLSNIIFTGPLFGAAKREAFAAADAFILPSYSEGAPMVVLEALGAGVPVITTMASPWKQLETHGCGLWTTIDQIGVQSALARVFEMSKQELAAMGARGRALVQRDYTWEQSARMTIEFYEWLQGETSTVPPFVSRHR